jgi:prevent-host-death family protein
MVTATDFKARCLSYLDEVKRTHQPILITKRGKLIAKLVPAENEQLEKPWEFLQKKAGKAVGDLTARISRPSDWEALSR